MTRYQYLDLVIDIFVMGNNPSNFYGIPKYSSDLNDALKVSRRIGVSFCDDAEKICMEAMSISKVPIEVVNGY